jgi:hypothetical protein
MPRPPVTGTPTIPSQPARRSASASNFSLLESHLRLAILARRFRPRLRDGFVPHFVMHGTLSIEDGLPAAIETR